LLVFLALALGIAALGTGATPPIRCPSNAAAGRSCAPPMPARRRWIHFWGLTCGTLPGGAAETGASWLGRAPRTSGWCCSPPIRCRSRSRQVATVLDHAGLAKAESWTFTDRFYERAALRGSTPTWSGELPRTMMIARDGHRNRAAGRRRPRQGARPGSTRRPGLDFKSGRKIP